MDCRKMERFSSSVILIVAISKAFELQVTTGERLFILLICGNFIGLKYRVDFALQGWATVNLHVRLWETWPSEVAAFRPWRKPRLTIDLPSLCRPRESRTVSLTCLRADACVTPQFLLCVPSRQLNKTCCLNGGTCMLGSFCACPPTFYGRNCEHDVGKENCGSVPHDTWLPRKCSMCKCWRGWLRCLPQTFLPGCGPSSPSSAYESTKNPTRDGHHGTLDVYSLRRVSGHAAFRWRVISGGHVMDEHLAASRTPELTLSPCTPLMLAGLCLVVQSFH